MNESQFIHFLCIQQNLGYCWIQYLLCPQNSCLIFLSNKTLHVLQAFVAIQLHRHQMLFST